jgi:hypothetical protein
VCFYMFLNIPDAYSLMFSCIYNFIFIGISFLVIINYYIMMLSMIVYVVEYFKCFTNVVHILSLLYFSSCSFSYFAPSFSSPLLRTIFWSNESNSVHWVASKWIPGQADRCLSETMQYNSIISNSRPSD